MITIKQDRLDFDVPFKDLLMNDTKAAIREILTIIGASFPASYTKEVTADALAKSFEKHPAAFVNALPDKELKTVFQLAFKKQNEFIAVPRNDQQFFVMQKLHLVVTYQDKNYWHIYMPDSIRNVLKRQIQKDFESDPEAKAISNLFEEFTGCCDRLFAMMMNMDPLKQMEKATTAKEIKEELLHIKAELKKREELLTRLQYPVKQVYSDIDEHIKLCEFQSKKKDGFLELVPELKELLSKATGNQNVAETEIVANNLIDSVAAHKMQELEDMKRDKDEPVDFSPAITSEPPQRIEQFQNYVQRQIRPHVIESVARLTETAYMVVYFVLQDGFILALCCWDDVLEFVSKGIEDDEYWDDYVIIKKHFRKKYPHISALYGIKYGGNGKPVPEPYINTIGLYDRPKQWWCSYRILDKGDEDFTDLAFYGVLKNEECLDVIYSLREACLDIFDEINNSDAKTPKEKMHTYFGVSEIPDEEIVDDIS